RAHLTAGDTQAVAGRQVSHAPRSQHRPRSPGLVDLHPVAFAHNAFDVVTPKLNGGWRERAPLLILALPPKRPDGDLLPSEDGRLLDALTNSTSDAHDSACLGREHRTVHDVRTRLSGLRHPPGALQVALNRTRLLVFRITRHQ